MIGNVPFPKERIESAYKIVVVKKWRGPGLSGADAWFESVFTRWRDSEASRAIAAQSTIA